MRVCMSVCMCGVCVCVCCVCVDAEAAADLCVRGGRGRGRAANARAPGQATRLARSKSTSCLPLNANPIHFEARIRSSSNSAVETSVSSINGPRVDGLEHLCAWG